MAFVLTTLVGALKRLTGENCVYRAVGVVLRRVVHSAERTKREGLELCCNES